jgi:hypothetical protein
MGELDYTTKLLDAKVENLQNRLLFATPTIGMVHMKWVQGRYNQVIPSNYSKVDMIQYLSSYIPLRYSIADAENLIAQEAVTKGYEWLIINEDDTILPPDALVRFNEYIREDKYPIVSGLYFTRSEPAEPMVYRGRGNSYFTDWKLGDKVMVDGVPFGCFLIKVDLLRAIWEDSPEYVIGGSMVARRIFETPGKSWFNEERGSLETLVGTSDLDFCKRIIEGGYLKDKWPELAKEKYPLVVDTEINCMHIDRNSGVEYPIGGILSWCEQNGNT